jgi:hypothetical protein
VGASRKFVLRLLTFYSRKNTFLNLKEREIMRYKNCHLRISEAEREAVRVHAEALGLTISDYMRQCIFGRKAKVRAPNTKMLAEVNGELRRIGSSLNQLAQVANGRGAMPELGLLVQLVKFNIAMRTKLAKALK